MKSRLLAVLALLASMLIFPIESALAQSSPTAKLDATEVFKRASLATVQLRVLSSSGSTLSNGSGFVVTDGRIVSNAHVVRGADRVEVLAADGQFLMSVSYAEALSESIDLVVLPRLVDPPGSLKLSTVAPPIGERIFAIGSPRGLANTISDGIVSGFRELEGRRLMQMTAPVSPGSSGGPVLNASAEVVGVTVSRLDGEQNLNFAVALADVRALLNSPPGRIAFPRSRQLASLTSEVERVVPIPKPSPYEHFLITPVDCVRSALSGEVACRFKVENLDGSGKKNRKLYVDAAYLADDLGIKSEAEHAEFGGKTAKLRGWTAMIDRIISPGETLDLVVRFISPAPRGRLGAITLNMSIGAFGGPKELVISPMPIRNEIPPDLEH